MDHLQNLWNRNPGRISNISPINNAFSQLYNNKTFKKSVQIDRGKGDYWYLSRLSIVGWLGPETPIPVVSEIAKAHQIQVNDNQLKNGKYYLQIIREIHNTPIRKITQPFSREDYYLIAHFINPYLDPRAWPDLRPSYLPEAPGEISFNNDSRKLNSALIRYFQFRHWSGFESLKTNFKVGPVKPNSPKNIDACILFRYCSLRRLNVGRSTTIREMEALVRMDRQADLFYLRQEIMNAMTSNNLSRRSLINALHSLREDESKKTFSNFQGRIISSRMTDFRHELLSQNDKYPKRDVNLRMHHMGMSRCSGKRIDESYLCNNQPKLTKKYRPISELPKNYHRKGDLSIRSQPAPDHSKSTKTSQKFSEENYPSSISYPSSNGFPIEKIQPQLLRSTATEIPVQNKIPEKVDQPVNEIPPVTKIIPGSLRLLLDPNNLLSPKFSSKSETISEEYPNSSNLGRIPVEDNNQRRIPVEDNNQRRIPVEDNDAANVEINSNSKPNTKIFTPRTTDRPPIEIVDSIECEDSFSVGRVPSVIERNNSREIPKRRSQYNLHANQSRKVTNNTFRNIRPPNIQERLINSDQSGKGNIFRKKKSIQPPSFKKNRGLTVYVDGQKRQIQTESVPTVLIEFNSEEKDNRPKSIHDLDNISSSINQLIDDVRNRLHQSNLYIWSHRFRRLSSNDQIESVHEELKFLQPKDKITAIILGAVLYQIDLSTCSSPLRELNSLVQYDGLIENYQPSDISLRERILPERLHFDGPILKWVFNPKLPRDLYSSQTLWALGRSYGFSSDELRAENPYSLLQMAVLTDHFYQGKPPVINNKKTPIELDSIDELQVWEYLAYGCPDSGYQIIKYSELDQLFRNYRYFRCLKRNKNDPDVYPPIVIQRLGILLLRQSFVGEPKEHLFLRHQLALFIHKLIKDEAILLPAEIDLRDCYRENSENQVIIDQLMDKLLDLTMKMRGWNGNHPYPILSAPIDNPHSVIVRVTDSIGEFDRFCGQYETISKIFLLYPLFKYQGGYVRSDDRNEGFTIRDRLNIVREGTLITACIRMTSNWLGATYSKIANVLGKDQAFNVKNLRIIG